MKRVIPAFICSLAICAAIACAVVVFMRFSGLIDNILSPGKSSVNNRESKITVVIDPGHGGTDGGAVGVSGILEKDLNLEVGTLLAGELTRRGFDVIMTRTDDVMLDNGSSSSAKVSDLSARLEIVRSCENPVFVSIHMNKFPDSSVNGFTVYYSSNNPDSELLAAAVRQSVTYSVQPENKRPMKAAGNSIFLLSRLTSPAVLLECGFLSNQREEALLSDPEYREKLVCAISDGIENFINRGSSGSKV